MCAGIFAAPTVAGCTPEEALAGDEHAVVLLYHHVADDTPASTSVRIADFERHLETIASLGLAVAPLEEVIDTLERSARLAEPTVVITFDDAWGTIIDNAAPRLAERDWPYTIFASTDSIDQGFEDFASWDDLRRVASMGAAIESHSRDHGHLLEEREADDWLARFTDNVTYSSARIEDELGRAPRFFAWPFGEFDAGTMRALADLDLIGFGQQSGVLAARDVTSDGVPSYVRSALPRFPISVFQSNDAAFRLRLLATPLPAKPRAFEYNVDDDRIPSMTLDFEAEIVARETGCFDAGGTRLEVSRTGTSLNVSSPTPLKVGRSKYTCTAPNRTRPGSWYWYSHPWFRPRADGTFPD